MINEARVLLSKGLVPRTEEMDTFLRFEFIMAELSGLKKSRDIS